MMWSERGLIHFGILSSADESGIRSPVSRFTTWRKSGANIRNLKVKLENALLRPLSEIIGDNVMVLPSLAPGSRGHLAFSHYLFSFARRMIASFQTDCSPLSRKKRARAVAVRVYWYYWYYSLPLLAPRVAGHVLSQVPSEHLFPGYP
jgi:hypothetical protein